jgi:hypothetical protein
MALDPRFRLFWTRSDARYDDHLPCQSGEKGPSATFPSTSATMPHDRRTGRIRNASPQGQGAVTGARIRASQCAYPARPRFSLCLCSGPRSLGWIPRILRPASELSSTTFVMPLLKLLRCPLAPNFRHSWPGPLDTPAVPSNARPYREQSVPCSPPARKGHPRHTFVGPDFIQKRRFLCGEPLPTLFTPEDFPASLTISSCISNVKAGNIH